VHHFPPRAWLRGTMQQKCLLNCYFTLYFRQRSEVS
jgi:hypothetical protein